MLCALLAACKPTIHSFRVDPNVACKGTAVQLTWDATSGGEIESQPFTPGIGKVAKTGTLAVTPSATTKFRFSASNLWGRAFREVDVDVRAASSPPKAIGASVADPSTTCEGTTLALTVVAPPTDWDEHVRVAEIELLPNVVRHYHVEHEGKSAELDPGQRSAVFAGLPARGKWLLSTPLQAGEACGQNVPRNLSINVYPACSEGTP
ncbi:MAG: hypothetical protein ACHQ53_02365 [Polyangiales bacterium]